MNQVEIWKDIKGYEGTYQVSNKGRVRSVDRAVLNKNYQVNYVKGKMLANIFDKDGYKQVSLYKKGTQKEFKIHRLVALTFIEKIDGKDCVNHKNCIKTDNNANNLEWCTTQENTEHAKANGLYMKAAAVRKYNKEQKGKDLSFEKIILDTQTGIFYDTVKDASDSKCIKFSYLKKALLGYSNNRTSLRYV